MMNPELDPLGAGFQVKQALIAIGSGGDYARSAALALVRNTKLSAKEVAVKALEIAGDICIYTNQNIHVEEL